MSKNILGLDIRESDISAVLINSSLKGNRIEAFTYVPLANQDEQAEMEKNVASAVEVLLENMDITDAVCIASFPADRISFRNIAAPFKQPKKIKQILPFELEPTLPHAVEDLIIDFQVLNTAVSEEKTNLLAAAVDITSLKRYLDLLASFEIEPERVTAGGYPVALCLTNLAKLPENTMFLDLDGEKSTLSAFSAGHICLIRSFPIGSEDDVRHESLCKNIQRTIHAFEDTTGLTFTPDRIFVTGSSPDETGLERKVAQQLDIPTQRPDLARDIELKIDNHPLPSWNPAKMDNALALALIEIAGISSLNFRKGPFAVAKLWAEHKKNLIRTGILAAVVLLLALFNIGSDFYAKQQKLNTLTSQISAVFKSSFPDVKRVVDPVQQMRVKINEIRMASSAPGKDTNGVRMIDILHEISTRITPEIDVEFSRLVVGEENVLISGDTGTFNLVDAMKSRLGQGDIFKEVTIVSTNKDKSGKRIRFKLKLEL